jgi:hypothetical protein
MIVCWYALLFVLLSIHLICAPDCTRQNTIATDAAGGGAGVSGGDGGGALANDAGDLQQALLLPPQAGLPPVTGDDVGSGLVAVEWKWRRGIMLCSLLSAATTVPTSPNTAELLYTVTP